MTGKPSGQTVRRDRFGDHSQVIDVSARNEITIEVPIDV
jgi:hypothetical protein